MLPVPKACSVVRRASAQGETECHYEKTNNGNNFNRGEDELSFAIDAHGNNVEKDNNHQNNGDPSGRLFGIGCYSLHQIFHTLTLISVQKRMRTTAAEVSAQIAMAQLYH